MYRDFKTQIKVRHRIVLMAFSEEKSACLFGYPKTLVFQVILMLRLAQDTFQWVYAETVFHKSREADRNGLSLRLIQQVIDFGQEC